ncbi:MULTISPECIES: hypothetical protein [Paenibacillus]|uniref:hypothetical protein n=1 Tax=Paenibacillus TaxID=44249 RepID=UPI00096D62D6|nr:hypothetical protein [Paenibacillus odorifer]OME07541.1 hypothetical protein BSK60_31155 [Paenibacillus odorifer]
MQENWPQISKEQSDLAFQFLRVIFSDDVDEYWRLISKVDKARIFGMHRQYSLETGIDSVSFREYVTSIIMPEHAEHYAKLRNNNPGVSTTLRYTEEGEGLLYLLENVTEPRVYEKETEVKVFPLIVTSDCEYVNGEVNAEWRVRMYNDKLYETLD